MKLHFEGKTKTVYRLENGHYLLKFKDDVTGVDGTFDPGANQVALSIPGIGRADLALSSYFFKRLIEEGVPCHFVTRDLEEKSMEVLPAKVFGKGVEVICRLRAVGSFIRRYGAYIEEGTALDYYVEFTLKDDARQDPLITEDALDLLGIISKEESKILVDLTKRITHLIQGYLAEKGFELYDIKYEFGYDENGNIMLIDELSGGNMRVFRDGASVSPMELSEAVLNED